MPSSRSAAACFTRINKRSASPPTSIGGRNQLNRSNHPEMVSLFASIYSRLRGGPSRCCVSGEICERKRNSHLQHERDDSKDSHPAPRADATRQLPLVSRGSWRAVVE